MNLWSTLAASRWARWPRRRERRVVRALAVLLLLAAPHAAAQQLPLKTYTTAEGLPHNSINRIVRDSRGFLWFCTNEGLARFDSYSFTSFGLEDGLPNASVNDFLETRASDYWVATNGGLIQFNPKGRRGTLAGTTTNAASMFNPLRPEGAPSKRIVATVLREGRDGTLWVGSDDGLYAVTRAGTRLVLRAVEIGIPHENPEQRIVADILEDGRGSLWIAAPSGLYRRWPDGSAARYTGRDRLPNAYLQNLLEDHDGRLWAATRLGGFFRFNADDSHRPPIVDLAFGVPELPTPWVFQLLETSDRRFWIASARGLIEFIPNANRQEERFRAYSTRNGLSYFELTALAEDAGGNLWLGTNNGGAMKLALNGLSAYGERDGLRQVSTVFNDRAGHLCFRGLLLGDDRASVFEGGRLDLVSIDQPRYYSRVGCFDGRRFTSFQPAGIRPLGWGWVTEGITLQTHAGEWWIGTGQGLYRYPARDRFDALRTTRPLAVYTPKDGLATWQVYRLFEDSRGDVWASSVGAETNGLARWSHLTETMSDLGGAAGLPPLKNQLPRAFGEDAHGNVWVGFEGQIARYRRGAFDLFSSSDGVPAGAIRDILSDRSGGLWLASAQGGLVRVDGTATARPTFVAYTTAQGMASNDIEALTEDVDGRIYAAGGRGVDRLSPANGHIEHFTTADGLAPGRFRDAFRDHSGVLWFGTTTGLARLAPVNERPPASPPIFINGVRVDGVPELISAVGEETVALPNLAPDQNQLQIDFVGLGFGSGDILRYQYKLEGSDVAWSVPNEGRSVTYARLGPGRYTFAVRAVNTDGRVSRVPAAMTFVILRPIWQRAWFVALAGLAISMTGYALHRYRIARLLDIANIRARIATDLHDDIGANLTRIALLSQAATHTYGRGPASESQKSVLDLADERGPLVSIARIARESIGSMSDIVWAINPARETLRDLTRRMRQHADEVFTQRGIELRFEARDPREDQRLAMEVRRDLLLIFKESVNNAARHSACTRVDIDFRSEGSRLVLRVADNGAGFDTSRQSDGQGLTSIQRRARRLSGTLQITSTPGSGTTVALTLPSSPAVRAPSLNR
jgi:signal transduction histidine kinase/ligand-binding sensor domain-containing protein